jgi:excisionase family DNA binding protein
MPGDESTFRLSPMSVLRNVTPGVSATGRMPLLTPDEVAAELRVTTRTVRRWARAGLLEQVQLGGRLVRYTPDSIEALIHPENGTSPPARASLSKAEAAADAEE